MLNNVRNLRSKFATKLVNQVLISEFLIAKLNQEYRFLAMLAWSKYFQILVRQIKILFSNIQFNQTYFYLIIVKQFEFTISFFSFKQFQFRNLFIDFIIPHKPLLEFDLRYTISNSLLICWANIYRAKDNRKFSH